MDTHLTGHLPSSAAQSGVEIYLPRETTHAHDIIYHFPCFLMDISISDRDESGIHNDFTKNNIEVASMDQRSSEETANDQNSSSIDPPSEETLDFLDKYLTVWILGVMIIGVLIGYFLPSSSHVVNSWSTGGLNWPIAIGLIMMMWPPLTRVKYDRIWDIITGQSDIKSLAPEPSAILSDEARNSKPVIEHNDSVIHHESSFKKVLSLSLILNWIIGPFLMFFLGIACLPDNHVPYIRGLILVGIARCIGMVVIWINLSSGSIEYATILVCLNSVFQIVFYSFYAYFFITILLPAILSDNESQSINVSFELVAESVAIYLGIPFSLGFGCWLFFNRILGTANWKSWYEDTFIPKTSPVATLALLFTIFIMFILQGEKIVSIPLNVLRVAVPLVAYFFIMFLAVYFFCFKFKYTREETITLAFTSASNNFELAIAISIAVFGLDSSEALVGVIGALVEVPVMLTFVHMIKPLHRWFPTVSNNDLYKKVSSISINDSNTTR